ncbi:hypothetical protein HBH65_159740 [Parastagonospora nodorum]|nr:hypothetical protein HBH94_173520 [Parastagonospora nodorum]KAH4506999.1 hypothetical protein HBH87_158890 [Parastagonospora nodorum]KAH4569386.1 hypothetical protein HBH83_230350 [Parastagonospora nodorum]KAH4759502.1 hypothetical protein HBH65_159740 [Parastagonospora nodorum]KAH5098088.1 hypothetical protein HBH71_241900 [Parastagonospora nodorum]
MTDPSSSRPIESPNMSFLLEKLCIDSHIEHKRAVDDEVEEEDLLISFVVPEQVPKAGLQPVWHSGMCNLWVLYSYRREK